MSGPPFPQPRWHQDRLAPRLNKTLNCGSTTAAVTAALEELDAAGVAIYADKEAMDTATPHGRAMLQMAAVFAELERGMIRERVKAGLDRARAKGKLLGRPSIEKSRAKQITARLAAGTGIGTICRELGVGSSTVQRLRGEITAPSPLPP